MAFFESHCDVSILLLPIGINDLDFLEHLAGYTLCFGFYVHYRR